MSQLQQICPVFGITTGGKPKCLYDGYDVSEAASIFAKAGTEYAEVAVWPRGVAPHRPRYPAKEAKAAVVAQAEAEAREASAKNRKRDEAKAKTAQARKLDSEALALQEEILKSEHVISPEVTLAPKKSKK